MQFRSGASRRAGYARAATLIIHRFHSGASPSLEPASCGSFTTSLLAPPTAKLSCPSYTLISRRQMTSLLDRQCCTVVLEKALQTHSRRTWSTVFSHPFLSENKITLDILNISRNAAKLIIIFVCCTSITFFFSLFFLNDYERLLLIRNFIAGFGTHFCKARQKCWLASYKVVSS